MFLSHPIFRSFHRASTGLILGGMVCGVVSAGLASAPITADAAGSNTLEAPTPSSESVDNRAWHNRLLLVFAPSTESPVLIGQRRIVHEAGSTFAERDLVTIEIVGDQVNGASDTADALRKRYGIDANASKVLLVGKDTGVKMTSNSPIAIDELTGTIDRMPMRRSEAKTQ